MSEKKKWEKFTPKIIQNLMKMIQKLNPTNSKSNNQINQNQHYETIINYHHQRI
jgi:hypothetical protein